ncbi:MAG TPA: SDR family oxidoreductase [Gemmatimonadales bacterium]|nr:SDR family oxidoreductase [Gemmatimonadales bacterium]
MTSSLTGKIALVTGASRGIGLAVSDELRAAGAHVVRLARSLSDGSSERQTDFRCDVSDAGQVDRVVGKVLKDLHAPDIVVNNAGIFFIKSLEETSVSDFAQAVSVNLVGPFLVSRALVPHLVKRGTGHLVTIGSIADHMGFTGSAAYGATKFGVRGMHESIVAELAGTGVRTTLVSPGPVDTDIWDPIDPDSKDGFTKRKDMLRAEDVAEAVFFAVTRPPRTAITEIRLLPTGYSARA